MSSGEFTYPVEVVKADRWGAWFRPIHGHGKHNYRLGCCSCDSVHELQFRVKTGKGCRPWVEMRLRPNRRATAAARRRQPRALKALLAKREAT